MNYELLVALGAVGAALALAFLYARASSKAAAVDRVTEANQALSSSLTATRILLAARENYLREIEKAHLDGLPASELAKQLNRLFAAGRSGAAGAVPAGERKTRTPGA